MNKIEYNVRQLFFIHLLLFCLIGKIVAEENDATEISRTKEIKRTFRIDKTGELNVDSKYGNITISNWNKNEIEIRVEIESKARNEARAQANLERAHIDIQQKGNKVYASTSLRSEKQSGNNESLSIHYYINIPSGVALKLQQSYGNIQLPDIINGKSELIVKYGNLNAGNFTNDLKVEAKYSNVKVGNISKATMDLGYCGKTEVRNGSDLSIDSKYSNLTLGNIKRIRIDKKYGNLKVNESDDLEICVKYSEVTIDKINLELKINDLSYTTMIVKQVAAEIRNIYAASRYGNLTLSLPSGSAFEVEATGMKYGNFKMNGFDITHTHVEAPQYYKYQVNGGGKIRIKYEGNNYGNITINKY